MSRYDSRTTTFSPDGRLHQVEYAMLSVEQAGAIVGVMAGEGIVVACEKKATNKLLATTKASEKVYTIDKHVSVAVAGLTSDANVLVSFLRKTAAQHRLQYNEAIPVESLVTRVADHKQLMTQYGGQRPFGVSFLFCGHDRHYKFQMYSTNPSGNYAMYRALALGPNDKAANNLLKKEFKESLSIPDALTLAVKVLVKTLDAATPSAETLELTAFRKAAHSDELVPQTLSTEEVTKLLDAFKVAEEEEKKKEEAKAAY